MKVKGLIFDYGATIDTNGMHWAEVLWNAYREVEVPVARDDFRSAYVYGERYLALHPLIRSTDNFHDVLKTKVQLQLHYLREEGKLPTEEKMNDYSLAVSEVCYTFAARNIERIRPVLQELSQRYPMVLVSNFYGNITAVLSDFKLDTFFKSIIESAVVGVRKPDPAIFRLGIDALELPPEQVVVVGDSYRKDIEPAKTLGCQTIWLKGTGWESEEPQGQAADAIISDFNEIQKILQI